MTELEGDESFIAVAQRNDTIKAMKTINAELLKFAVSAALIVGVAVSGLCAGGVTTAVAMTNKTADEVLGDAGQVIMPKAQYEFTYEVEGEGYIEGDIFQVVYEGDATDEVVAVAFDGWVFSKWSDGVEDPYRSDANVVADTFVVAIFEQIEEGEGEGEPGEGEGEGSEADRAEDEPGEGEGEGESSDEGNGEGEGGQEGGGGWEASDMINDGNTPYGSEYGNMVEGAAGNSGSLDGMVGDFLGGIGGTGGSGNGN